MLFYVIYHQKNIMLVYMWMHKRYIFDGFELLTYSRVGNEGFLHKFLTSAIFSQNYMPEHNIKHIQSKFFLPKKKSFLNQFNKASFMDRINMSIFKAVTLLNMLSCGNNGCQ